MDTVVPVVRRLRGLAHGSPDLKEAAQCYESIVPLLSDADHLAKRVSITSEEACAKMERGQPLLHDLDLELDGQAVAGLMLRLARALETVPQRNRPSGQSRPLAPASQRLSEASSNAPIRTASAHKIRLAFEENRLDVRALLPHIFAGENSTITFLAQRAELDPGLVGALAQNAIKPALRVWCRQLAPLARGIRWDMGYCFICGAGATFGELQGNQQAKHLRCGNCGGDWPFPRLRCARCGNEDHRSLGYLYPENRREEMGIEVCSRCNGYLKIIAAFDPTPPEMLPVEDLATLHLDYIAQARGYTRGGTGSVQSCLPGIPSP